MIRRLIGAVLIAVVAGASAPAPAPEIGTALYCENVQGEAVCFEIGE